MENKTIKQENQVRITLPLGMNSSGVERKKKWLKASRLAVGTSNQPNGKLLEWIRRVCDEAAFRVLSINK